MNVSASFALEGNNQILSTLSPFRTKLKDVSYYLFWSNFYLVYKSSPLKGLPVHLSMCGGVSPFDEDKTEKKDLEKCLMSKLPSNSIPITTAFLDRLSE